MSVCRVVTRPDGGVSVVHPNPRNRRPHETDAEQLARATPEELRGLPFVDLDPATLPARAEPCADCGDAHPVRDQWRLRGNRIEVDRSLPNLHAQRRHAERDLDAELAKPNPDLVTVLRLQRSLGQGRGR